MSTERSRAKRYADSMDFLSPCRQKVLRQTEVKFATGA
jgi:hypothetical protein